MRRRKLCAWLLAAAMMLGSVQMPVMADETADTKEIVIEETQETQTEEVVDQTSDTEESSDTEETEVIIEAKNEEETEEGYVDSIDETSFDTVDSDVATTRSWKDIYSELGVDTSSKGDGYYDVVSSATKYSSYHAKDIPSVVNKGKATIDGEEQPVLDGVILSGKVASITPKLSSASHTDSSKYGKDEFVIVPDDTVEGYVWNDYIANLYAVTISYGNKTVGAMPWVDFYGEAATSGPHYNKVQISLNTGTSIGSNKATVHRYDAFYDTDGNLKSGTYTVTLYAEGFKKLTAEVEVLNYEYMYASLSWNEYWANEGVMAAGSTESSSIKDDNDELDKGAYDVVTRATTTHGVHRGSYQCSATIYDTTGKTYELSHWSSDGKTMYFNDGRSASWDKGTMTFTDGSTASMDYYTLNGMKYVPVRVARKDAQSFKKAYKTVANGESLKGGYGEGNLSSYNLKAAVDKTTNGLKTASKNADGSFSFSAAGTGTGSGTAEAQKTVDQSKLTVTVKDASGSYGEFLRVDLTGEEYGPLGAKMYAVTWKYFGSTDPASNARARALVTYGTKFAADNWMHKANGIQLGLTESARCQLPADTDGTGYWQIVVKAMGYSDTTINFQVSDSNIVKKQAEQTITTSQESYKKSYGQKAFTLGAKTDGDGKLTYATSNSKVATVSSDGTVSIKGVGTTQITITASATDSVKEASKTVNVTVGKGSQPLKLKVAAKTFKVKAIKKKAATFSIGASAAAGKVTYTSSSKKVKVTSKGLVTVKKGSSKGKYKITVKAAGNANYNAGSKVVTITLK